MKANKYVYVFGYNAVTYFIVEWITGSYWLAAICGIVSGYLASGDWEKQNIIGDNSER